MRRKYIGFLLALFFAVFILNYFFCLRPLLFKKNLVSREVIALKRRLKAQQKDLIEYSAARKNKTLKKRQFFLVPDGLAKQSKHALKLQGSYCPLSHYPLSNLKVVGCLVADRIDKKCKKWGLLELPNGQICKVEVSNEIGIEKAKIIFIDFKKIIVQEKNRKTILNSGVSHLEEKYGEHYKQ
ncbi:MAG: pilus assembly protein PilP [Rickettsia endosymbiont of Ixodes persulcatus]|nr:pilus assembly protein PilP [Rickettsia endosymbiont of Ixodes persulcatus]